MAGPQRGRADFLEIGDFNAACSMCGRKRKATSLVKNWQGLYRCPKHNEPRQPQDFARGVKEVISVPWAQVETDQFTSICTLNERSAIPGLAGPGCSIPGNTVFNADMELGNATGVRLGWLMNEDGVDVISGDGLHPIQVQP